MSSDKPNYNALSSMVIACRKRLNDDITDQLQGIFGLHPDGTVLPVNSLGHLTDLEKDIAENLRRLLEYLMAAEIDPEKIRRITAYQRMVREIGFTVLNRLAALRMCEERGLVIECVRKGMASDGFQLFDQLTGGTLGTRYQTYRVFLENLFDELSIDLGVLFDRTTPHSQVFPTERCLEDVLGLINDPELYHLWTEDETIGWIYQFYNDKKERKEMRDTPPRNSRELAVRNQFFTPRYVVEYLTDNTLGHTWYEMMQGKTRLKEECKYLVRRPIEIFLGMGEDAPENPEADADFSREELLKQPVYIPFRPKKDPREIKILDPACGSGHFLLYCFDLLETIYEEAWADSSMPAFNKTEKSISQDYHDLKELKREIPGLILRYNLYGIDIDPRACQIATLALWLRAQRSYREQGLKVAKRPLITKSNIICAEPMPGKKEMLEDFVGELRPKVLGQLVRVIFEKMKQVGETGFLLKIDLEISEIVSEARKQYREEFEYATDKNGNRLLFTKAQIRNASDNGQPRIDFSDFSDEQFWNEAEARVVSALCDYAHHVSNGEVLARRLFVEDTEQGFAFIDICRERFDVVLMNPPFGEASPSTIDYLYSLYPTWNKNLLCAFIERGWEISSPLGMVGVIYDRTAIVKSTYEDFRRRVLIPDNRLAALADLGWEVLDANVEVTTSVLRHSSSGTGLFVDARNDSVYEKRERIKNAIKNLSLGHMTKDVVLVNPNTFRSLPNAVIGYDFYDFLIEAFKESLSLASSGYIAFTGHQVRTEKHFRLWWETSTISPPFFIARLFNGAGFSPVVASMRDIIISEVELENLPRESTTNLRNKDKHLLPGICYGKRGEYFCVHVLPRGFYFSLEGLAIPVLDEFKVLEIIGVLNTPLARASINKFCGQHKTSGYINLFPFRSFNNLSGTRKCIMDVIQMQILCRQFDETQSVFSGFLLGNSIADYANQMTKAIENTHRTSIECETFCHEESLRAYRVSIKERELLESFRSRQPKLESPIEDADISAQCKWLASHSVISHAIGCIYGRWDIRIAKDQTLAPKLQNPFDPLPICSPAMLISPDGLSARYGSIVSEEWLRARPDVNFLPPEGSVKQPTIPDSKYPINIKWDGILVDDPDHSSDIVRRARMALGFLWVERADDIEQEVCELVGERELRDYFHKPSGFFQDHLKRYSKSRRQAPIYWPLSTASGNYTLWIYYHRLSSDTLYTSVNKYVNPKIAEVERQIGQVDVQLQKTSGREATNLRNHLNNLKSLQSELNDFKEELLRVAGLPYKPNLNDGVIINAAPLHKLFRLPKWARDTKACWEKLEKGEYNYAHLAYTIWPDRVREVCKKDHSIAIAHDLEGLYLENQGKLEKPGKSRLVKRGVSIAKDGGR